LVTKSSLQVVGGVIVAVAVVALVVLILAGNLHLGTDHSGPASADLPASDEPPLEFIYLDPARVDDYLSQIEGGLSTSQQRTDQVTKAISATLSGSLAAQLSASESSQEGTQETVTPTAADRLFLLLRIFREGTASSSSAGCPERSGRWLWRLAEPLRQDVVTELNKCVGVGRFVRIDNVQLFLPPFAQVLPNAQSATAVYGGEPWGRYPFTSPTQSATPKEISAYTGAVGRNPRLPFIGASFGSSVSIGPPLPQSAADSDPTGRDKSGSALLGATSSSSGSATLSQRAGATSKPGSTDDVAVFLPLNYNELTTEPSLLSGSVTVVGKVVYYSGATGPAYIDYPTISEFGRALLGGWKTGFDDAIGVCSVVPPGTVQAHPKRVVMPSRTPTSCISTAAVLRSVKRSVTLRGPYIVLLPLAIYQ
jgi:hypothetical protein